MIELNKIYNEDCLEGMKRIPDGSIDMILCDLPYGTTKLEWDSVIDLDLLWEQYNRIIKDNGAIVLTAQTPFDKVLGVSNLKMLKYEWIWEKSKATGFLNSKIMPLKAHENILVFYKKLPTYNPQKTIAKPYLKNTKDGNGSGIYNDYKEKPRINKDGSRLPRTVQYFKTPESEGKTIHPTQKSLALFEYLIKTYTNENELILDNCMGSGTTAIACLNTGRNFIGFETNEEYYNKSLQRIKDNVTQLDLFNEDSE